MHGLHCDAIETTIMDRGYRDGNILLIGIPLLVALALPPQPQSQAGMPLMSSVALAPGKVGDVLTVQGANLGQDNMVLDGRDAMEKDFGYIELRVPPRRFENWERFVAATPEYSIGLEVIDDTPGCRGNHVHFDHHSGVIREATMSAAMQAYIAVRQGRLMQRWLAHRCPVPVYVWNADQDVCLASFILEYHELLEQFHSDPLLRWIVQFNNKVDVCGGLYPVDLAELVQNHFTWVFEPFREQRMKGKMEGDEALVKNTIRHVCNRLEDLLQGRAGVAPITAEPEILYTSARGFVIADEKGDPNSRLVLAAQGHTNLISLVCRRKNGRYT